MKETADISITIGLLEAEIDSLKDAYKNCKFSALKREYSTQLVSHKQALKMLKQAAALEPLINQEVEKRIKERMGAEIEEFGIYVDLLKADADLIPDKHDYYKRGAQMAYSHCWFTFYRILEKLRSCLTCSEKPNNSQKTEGGTNAD